MPASPTRECPRCQSHRLIAEFRDEGDVTRGRPPGVCRYCRVTDVVAQARQDHNRNRRVRGQRLQRWYATRTSQEIAEATQRTHPDGVKACPEVSGCGATLALDAFRPDRFQQDGLSTRCCACLADEEIFA